MDQLDIPASSSGFWERPSSNHAKKFLAICKRTVLLWLILLLLGLNLGCTQYLSGLASAIPNPPPLAQAAPRLSNLSVTPSNLPSGRVTTITISFDYEDWNEDVGPTKVKLWRKLEVIEGNFTFPVNTRELLVNVNARGRYGSVTHQIDIGLPYGLYGTIRLSVSIYDNYGNRASRLSTMLYVQ